MQEQGIRYDFGSSRMCFEPPNTCFVTYVGDLDADIVARMNAALEETMRRHEPVDLLVDLSRTGQVTELVRRHAVGGMLALNPRATAVFGADFHLRVVVSMITKAIRLLHVDLRGQIKFFDREADARAWLAEVKRKERLQRSA
ncbi:MULTISPECIES: STAS/SEC14 domain-containing protein [Polyangium]|uniref:STAS/SEC14 domain-containing protein n=2 Tax=Polyangium TaxID=55 RepID=A0A4U1JBL4_9BACT|nr:MULTISPECIES: STAS/SEC14 domain-containing protein [Polyangium]MDI1432545.1 STAS/SEC14 domain-containing protein [Polyangium sorediatum]TKD04987.1 STAS/SEC14 domain-containing protein [Polyangium fumosum]TKD05339.1 STAS/SEC14 domain-containing protein [Polyangium fumosum]